MINNVIFAPKIQPMKRLSFSLLLLLGAWFQAYSQTKVDEATAYKTAQAFAENRLATKGHELDLVSAEGIYIYNIGTQGFVIVSGNTVLPPILGYSDHENFPEITNAPENFSAWIGHYSEMIAFAEEKGIAPEAKIQRLWDEAERGVFGAKEAKTVTPLVETRWNQDCYYNEYCPATSGWWGGPCGHVYAGCVATAMAQVMKYWDYPATGFGSHSYVHSTYGQQSADFAATTYHWDEMPNEIWGHNDAIATLLYHCGVSVDMNYSASGSGAQSKDVETALRSYFGYCGAKYKQKSSFSDDDWIAMLKAELDQSRPVYYSGANGDSGHAFVCDGYDNNDLFHFNFGWSGSGDDYYSIYDVHGFSSGQAAVTNIYPLAIRPDANGIIYVSEDGTGDGSSWANATSKFEYATALSSGGGTKVWVKKGTYYGDTNDPNSAFYITANNQIHGGFKGDEEPGYNLSQRDFINNATILDGQGVRRVLTQEKSLNGSAAIWDGFTIRNGKAGSGAGAYLDNYTTLSNCIVAHNEATMFGGGIYANSGGGTPHVSLINCTVIDNAASMGGGVCDRIGCIFSNCRISNNTASTKGGGIYLYNNAEPTFKNCVVANNTAENAGAMYARGKFTAYNSNFVANNATESVGGLFIEDRYSKMFNCIIWGNKRQGQQSQTDGSCKAEYCAVQGGMEGTDNINLQVENDGEEPGCFVRFNDPSPESADWSLQSNSICLNAGKPNTAGLGASDIAGDQRIQNGRVEIGAYESCASLTQTEAAISGNNPYDFHGRFLTQEGYYTAVLDGHDCDSVVGLTLSVYENVTEDAEASIHVWPNPTNGLLHIEAEDLYNVEVRNLLGQLVLQAEKAETIDLNGFEKGVYFLIVSNKKGFNSVKKIIKE